MFKIKYDLENKTLVDWVKQFKITDYPKFKVIASTDDKLVIGTKFILQDEEDKSFWYGVWSVGIKGIGEDSYVIRKIINIKDFINGNSRSFEYTRESIFNSDYYYKLSTSNRRYDKLDILDFSKMQVFKLPNSECPRLWLMSTSWNNKENKEEDIKMLTALYTDVNSKEYSNHVLSYRKFNPLNEFDKSIKSLICMEHRDLILSQFVY